MKWPQRSPLVPALILAVCVTAPAVAFAGANSGHKIAVHALSHGGHTCKSIPTFTECGDIVTTYPDSGDVDDFPAFLGFAEYTVVGHATIQNAGDDAKHMLDIALPCATLSQGPLPHNEAVPTQT